MLLIPDVVVRFAGFICKVMVGFYPAAPDQLAIQLVSQSGHEPIAKATICQPDNAHIHFPTVLVKDYSENAGMVLALQLAGVIRTHPPVLVQAGHATAYAFLLTQPVSDAVKRHFFPELDPDFA